MTHNENRISDLIDGGLHDKSCVDRAKYELHMLQKAAIEKAATKLWEDDAKYNPNPNNPYAYRNGVKAAAKEIIEHPERYGLTARKPIGTQEARKLVNQMLAEEISFSRFVELINEGENKMKTKQWFLDRVGKEVLRDLHAGETKINTSEGFKTVFIADELQAQYMFDLQQELYHDSNVNLNYRDKWDF